MKTEQLLFYRNYAERDLLNNMMILMEEVDNPPAGSEETDKTSVNKEKTDGTGLSAEQRKNLCAQCLGKLYSYASDNGFYGNLWHCYLTELLVYDENPYTIACEMRGHVEGSLNEAVLHDLQLFQEWFHYDLSQLNREIGEDLTALVLNYQPSQKEAIKYNKFIRREICILAEKLARAENVQEFKLLLDSFYGKYGVGVFGLHKAFRVEGAPDGKHDKMQINPIYNIAVTSLDDIVGYEIPKKKIIDNTEAFLQGKKTNNCLIYGDAGTGKSSSIRAILNTYYDRGLRMIEVYKHQYKELNELIDRLKCRNYKFIIYMDDLSFEEFETEYKYLKAVIEGGLESKPDNVLIYATSNRRHLIKENFSDKDGDGGDIHKNETVQEKLSLFARFGVSIYFGAPTPQEFQNIVITLAKQYDIIGDSPEEEKKLLLEANKWELSHGGLSGRTARQFIDYMRHAK